MDIVLIILVLVLVGTNFFILYKTENRIQEPKKVEKEPKLTKEEKEKQKQLKKSFENLMNYDEKTARHRK